MKRIWYEDIIKEYVEKQGYKFIKLIKDNGLNSRIEIQCPKGHKYDVCFKNFKGNACLKGTRCPECFGSKKPSYEEVREYVEDKGFTLLSKEYKKANVKLKIECPNGHVFERTRTNLQRADKNRMSFL